jgi:KUP system potassium uptake protein
VVHTSAQARGQIYMPALNWLLMLATVAVVLGFRSSDSLAAAFGLAVSTTMAITTVIFAALASLRWGWSPLRIAAVAGPFLVVDLAFLGANTLKFVDGGWLPLLLGSVVYVIMVSWHFGRIRIAAAREGTGLAVEELIDMLRVGPPHRVQGTAVFLSENSQKVPAMLLHHLKHNQVLHERVVLLTMDTVDLPRVKAHERVAWKDFGEGFAQLVARYGYMESPNVPELLREASGHCGQVPLEPMSTSFYLGRESLLLSTRGHPLKGLMLRMFAWLRHNEVDASSYFGIPANRVVELGARRELAADR